MTSDESHAAHEGIPAAPPTEPAGPSNDGGKVTLGALRTALRHFCAERDWGQFHTPRNLVLALTGEVGELAECFQVCLRQRKGLQWRGEVACGLPGFADKERQHVGEELADVLLYLVRLADACGIDLGAVALDKLAKNAAKYPVHACRGSAAKYTELRSVGAGSGSGAAGGAGADGKSGGASRS
eukprot:scaffold7.g3586.t1